MTISPCAMLMTPITPKVMARPMAASSSTEPSDRPYQRFWATPHSASSPLMTVIALSAAACTASGASGGKLVSKASASWSPRSRMTADGLDLVGLAGAGHGENDRRRAPEAARA